ncbi:uncharacterized protein LOC133038333 [Cannabis sativa]|uniref:uncharacterized protein LOC133038333 n=1 Tax=Cannabis sativa TaxID=3483 RepID=UPI0029CA48B0|nr:uncharacterized protein LOC133038333 [Cannabis sativa]
MNNPMVSLWTDNKIFGANFVKWKENINIALIGQNALFVLTEEAHEQPSENATKVVKEKFECWQNANNKARYFMLSRMVDTLKTRFANTLMAADIMNQLTELFGMASIQARFEATKNFINPRMKPHQNLEFNFHELINHLKTFENLIGGPHKGGTKAPSSGTANGTTKAETNIASTSKPNNKKNRKNSKKPLN